MIHTSFKEDLLLEIKAADNRIYGEKPAPWDVLVEYICALEERVKVLETSVHAGGRNG